MSSVIWKQEGEVGGLCPRRSASAPLLKVSSSHGAAPTLQEIINQRICPFVFYFTSPFFFFFQKHECVRLPRFNSRLIASASVQALIICTACRSLGGCHRRQQDPHQSHAARLLHLINFQPRFNSQENIMYILNPSNNRRQSDCSNHVSGFRRSARLV